MADCLPDILISELPRTTNFNYDDLLVIDTKLAAGGYETHSITWGTLLGLPSGDGSGGDLVLNLNRITRFPDGTELIPSISFINDPDTGFYRPGNNSIGFTTGGTNAMIIKNQYVGIGTVVPQERLHVNQGNLKVTLGVGDNAIVIGSSGSLPGGDPAIKTVGNFPLIFQTNSTQRLKISEKGAFGLLGSSVFYGDDKDVISSVGSDGNPVWRNVNDLLNWQLIENFLLSIVGNAEIQVVPEDWVDATAPKPGVEVQIIREQPTANSKGDPVGWKVRVDDTVIRTFGDQTMDGNKTLAAGGNSGINFSNLPTLP